jgi:hypothetical protein
VSSNPICVLLVLMVFIMILSGVIVICVIISINYYYRQDLNDVSSCMKRLLLYYHKNGKTNYVKDGSCISRKNFNFYYNFICHLDRDDIGILRVCICEVIST